MCGALVLLAAIATVPELPDYPDAGRSGDTITLTAGATAKVTLRVALIGTPTRDAQVLVRTSGWTGVAEVLPMGEIARTHERPPSADVVILISANAVTGRARRGAVRVIVHDPQIGRRVGETLWRPTLKTLPGAPEGSVSEMAEQLRSARLDLNAAMSAAGPSAAALRKSGMVMLRPEASQWFAPVLEANRHLGHVQAIAARIRAVAPHHLGAPSRSSRARAGR